MKNVITLFCTAIFIAVLTGCSGNGNDMDQDQSSILDVARSAGSFDTLVTAIEAAGLGETLSGSGEFTVFAPSDDAFARLPEGTVNSLLQPDNIGKLADILTYHVVAGTYDSAQVAASSELATAFGQSVSVSTSDGVAIGNAISMASITQTDITASNGVIHVIDTVLLPMDIVDLADSAGSFTTLLTALQAAGLDETLRGEGPFTVFAPTDAAFAALPEGTLDSLLLPENSAVLADILTYHVASGEFESSDLANGQMLQMANGTDAEVSIGDQGTLIDEANIVVVDLIAANGIVHVIDAVILPD